MTSSAIVALILGIVSIFVTIACVGLGYMIRGVHVVTRIESTVTYVSEEIKTCDKGLTDLTQKVTKRAGECDQDRVVAKIKLQEHDRRLEIHDKRLDAIED